MSEVRPQVLVTGAGGFIGSHLVRDQLGRGRAVVAADIALDRLEALRLSGPLRCEHIDVRESETLRPLLRDTDTVFHLAAAHLDVLKDEAYFYEVNERASAELVRLAAESGVRRFVHCSTVGVYGPLERLPANEETPPAPDIPYERSKLAGELAVRAAASEGSLTIVILRPAWVYGPLCPRTAKLVRTIARKRFFFVGDGSNLRHPIYISDMLQALELAARVDLPSSEPMIVAGPEAITVRGLVELIVSELGMSYRPPRVPAWPMKAACAVVERVAGLTGREPPFSSRSLKFFSESSAFDTSRAESALGFRAEVGNRDGLRQTIRHLREQGIL